MIGQEEVDSKTVDIRTREGERIGKYTVEKLVEYFKTLEPKISAKREELIKKISGGLLSGDFDEQEKKRLEHEKELEFSFKNYQNKSYNRKNH